MSQMPGGGRKIPGLVGAAQRLEPCAPSGIGAPERAHPVQLASFEVVTQASSSMGLPQYVSLIPGLATWTLPNPFA